MGQIRDTEDELSDLLLECESLQCRLDDSKREKHLLLHEIVSRCRGSSPLFPRIPSPKRRRVSKAGGVTDHIGEGEGRGGRLCSVAGLL